MFGIQHTVKKSSKKKYWQLRQQNKRQNKKNPGFSCKFIVILHFDRILKIHEKSVHPKGKGFTLPNDWFCPNNVLIML